MQLPEANALRNLLSVREPSMEPEDRPKIGERVQTAAERALSRQGYVSPIDVLVGMGWLDSSHVKRWTLGQLDFLEAGLQVKPARLSEALRSFQTWASAKGLRSSEAEYQSRTPERSTLRFSERGDSDVERDYRTHWMSPDLPEKKRQRLEQKANRPPELVVIQPHGDWTCHRCGGSGGLLIMEPPGPACMKCAGLGELEFLPAGDAGLSRRAKAASSQFAVVVRFSRARKRYERQGILVEAAALRAAKQKSAPASED